MQQADRPLLENKAIDPALVTATVTTNNLVTNIDFSINRIDDQNDDNETSSLIAPRSIITKAQTSSGFLYIIDVLLSVVFFSPLVALYWYGTWLFLDNYFIESNYRISSLICWLIGLAVLLPGYMLQLELQRIYEWLGDRAGCYGTLFRFLMRLVYTYLICLAVLMQWRGLWNLLGIYFNQDWMSQMTLATIATAYFCLSRSTKSLNTTPFLLFIDDFENFFTSKSKIQVTRSSQHLQFLIDYMITELVECFGLVLIWRGFESLTDTFIFPNNQLYSIFTCLASSHVMFLLVAIAQHFVFRHTSRHGLIARLFVQDFVHMFMFASSVLAWKFYWNCVDFFLVNDQNQLYVYLGFHVVPFVLVIMFRTSAILVGPGVSFLDGELDPEINAYFDINYLGTFFQDDYNTNNRIEPYIAVPTSSINNNDDGIV